ncbi:MAG: M16 family metallopeptidase [Beijerinckiaceae bacterium]
MKTAAPEPRITTLPSGLRVVTLRMPHVETASLAIVAGAGSRDEMAGEHGLAHFLEHMAFKGTRRRSAKGIAEAIEAVGGDINAATSTETTAYTARLLGADVPLGMDVLADIISDSVFDPKEIRREKGVVLQEIAAVADTPDDLVHDIFSEIAFADQQIGLPILGTAKTVRALDAERLRGFLGREYVANRMVVAAAGAVDHDQVVREAEKRLAAFRPGSPVERPAAVYTGGERRLNQRLEQGHVLLGFAAPSHQHPDFYPAQIFASALGGGMSSRLFQEVREKRGYAYAVYTFVWGYSDIGLFGVYFGAGEKTVGDAMSVTLDCLMAATSDLSDEEIGRAKAQLKVSLLSAMESSGARADQMARHLLAYGRVISAAEIIARVDAITPEEVRAVGARMLATRPTLAAIGPARKLPDLDAIAGRTGFQRAA